VHATHAQLVLWLLGCHLRVITAQVDFLLAAMRELAAARPDLNLLLMSATLNSANISEYFAAHISGAAACRAVELQPEMQWNGFTRILETR
jgi:hypothetical protein